MSRRPWIVGAAAATLLAAPGRPPAPTRTAITGVTIIDGNGGPPLESGVILVSGERIEAVGPAAAVRIPRGGTRAARQPRASRSATTFGSVG